jgi:hypothetical protein
MSHERDDEALLARIDRLERGLTRLRRMLTMTAAGLLFALLAVAASNWIVASAQGRAVPGEIVATSMKLVDATGRPRAALYVDGQTAGLAISDPSGQTRMLLNSDGEVTKFAIVGAKQGFPRIVIAQSGGLQMVNLEDQTSAIGLTHSGAPAILVASGGSSARLEIAESFPDRLPKPTLTPTLTLTQGSRTLVTLPAPPPR